METREHFHSHTMDWQTFKNQLNATYREIKATDNNDNPLVRVFDDYGREFRILEVYTEDGIVGIDVKVVNETTP